MATIDSNCVRRFDIPIESIGDDLLQRRGIRIDVLRLDKTDSVISGNKWFKLVCNIETARKEGYTTLLSFGGAWSNHLVAFAAAAREAGFASIGIVRGLHGEANLTPSLQYCLKMGMQLHFISREEYALKGDTKFLNRLRTDWGSPYIIPEGGANAEGRAGAGLIASYIPADYTHVCVSVGSGTTLAGLRQQLPLNQTIIGFAPMKQGRYLTSDIASWLSEDKQHQWQLTDDYHFGGFGKFPPALQTWADDFFRRHQIPLDRVYTAKMMYGVLDMVQSGAFETGARILCIHTGGLQGNG